MSTWDRGLAAALGFQRSHFTLDGRPIAQCPRVRAGRDDDLGTMPDG